MEMGLQITFRQKWLDPRLQFTTSANSTYISLPTDQKIWKPDTFFRNEISGNRHTMLQDNSYVRIFPDGFVLTSTRLTVNLVCPMELRRFPFDTQTCPIQLASCTNHHHHHHFIIIIIIIISSSLSLSSSLQSL